MLIEFGATKTGYLNLLNGLDIKLKIRLPKIYIN